MYLGFLVDVPAVQGKITRKTKNGITYINYEYGRVLTDASGIKWNHRAVYMIIEGV